MFSARYHVALVGKGMVSNLIISPVSLGFAAVHECVSEHGIFSMESIAAMLTDTKLRNLKPKEKLYKVNDRDGLYVAVTAAGSISFRYNYSINGRQETITFGRYGVGGITLAEARERLGEAKKMVSAGKSPAKYKARAKARTKGAETFAPACLGSARRPPQARLPARRCQRRQPGATPVLALELPATVGRDQQQTDVSRSLVAGPRARSAME